MLFLLLLGMLPVAEGGARLPAGNYACWLSGLGTYRASALGTIAFGADGNYQASKGAGSYRLDAAAATLKLSGGPLDGWVGAVGASASGPSVRFRAESPGDPGPSLKIGDHVCRLRSSGP
jgi:hypothetical protein